MTDTKTEYRIEFRTPKEAKFPKEGVATNGKWEFLREAATLEAAEKVLAGRKASKEATVHGIEYRITSREVTYSDWSEVREDFIEHLVEAQIAKRDAKATTEQRFQAGVEEVHQQFLAEKRAEQSEPWNEPWNEQRFQGPGENDG